jgi:hypothetical protein
MAAVFWEVYYTNQQNKNIKSQMDIKSDRIKLTLWRRNFLLNFSTPVYKIWIIEEPEKVALRNKRHFEEEETESMQHVWNIQYVYLLNK